MRYTCEMDFGAQGVKLYSKLVGQIIVIGIYALQMAVQTKVFK